MLSILWRQVKLRGIYDAISEPSTYCGNLEFSEKLGGSKLVCVETAEGVAKERRSEVRLWTRQVLMGSLGESRGTGAEVRTAEVSTGAQSGWSRAREPAERSRDARSWRESAEDHTRDLARSGMSRSNTRVKLRCLLILLLNESSAVPPNTPSALHHNSAASHPAISYARQSSVHQL